MDGAETTAPDGGLLLKARGVTKRFGGLLAVNSVDFDIPKGAIVSLIGPNGAGQPPFFSVIAGIYGPTAGVIDFHGRQMIARPQRSWLEPFLWFLPAFIGGAVVAVAPMEQGNEAGDYILRAQTTNRVSTTT